MKKIKEEDEIKGIRKYIDFLVSEIRASYQLIDEIERGENV